ncbi:MAG TPA: hydrogenase maturation protease [Verrucomicrobiae bacterium]|nr:hydrogenase maturation protease [Verrucomicrobiae bacterium]
MEDLIIGCGNRDRGDDAAGLVAAERLFALGFAAKLCSGEPSGLIDAWAGYESVILIDAVVTGTPAGTVYLWDAENLPPISTTNRSTHGLGIAQAIQFSRELGSFPRKFRMYGIEAVSLELHSRISPDVQKAIDEVVRQISARPVAPR